MLLASVQRLDDLLARLLSLLLLIGQTLLIYFLQETIQSPDGIVLLPPHLSLILRPVQRRVIRSRMVAHPIGHKLNKIRLLMLQNIIPSVSGGLITS